MHTHITTFTHGDTVYLKTDTQQLKRMVIACNIRPKNLVYYEVACGETSSFHSDIELSAEVNESIRLGIEQEK